MAAFDVPENRGGLRARLRRKLRELHFGCLQNSLWITPNPLETITRELTGEKIDVEMLTFLEARPCGGESNAELAAGAWDFARLNRMYREYHDILRAHPATSARRSADPEAWLEWLGVEWRAWRAITRLDPLLPNELLPADYAGKLSWELRRQTWRQLGRRLAEMKPPPSSSARG